MARRVDRPVKLLVFIIIGIGVFPRRCRLAPFVGIDQSPSILVRVPPGCMGACEPLYLGHEVEHLEHPLRRRVRNDGASPGPYLHQTYRAQLHQCFPHRRPRHTEARRKLHFVKAFSGLEVACHDTAFDLVTQFVKRIF